VVSAAAISVTSFLVSDLATRLTGRGLSSVLPLGDRIVISMVLGATLVVGMRLALSESRKARASDGAHM
jgi:hypothetical protein